MIQNCLNHLCALTKWIFFYCRQIDIISKVSERSGSGGHLAYYSYDAPSYFRNKVVPFSFPVFFPQFKVTCVIFMGKGIWFGCRILELLFCNYKVNFVIIVGLGWSYFFLANYIWQKNFSTKSAVLLNSADVFIFDLGILVENIHVGIAYNCLDVFHATVTLFLLNILLKEWCFWMCLLSIWFRKYWPILVVTLLLYGWLNHITFR